jgi:hypothetical protein
MMRIVILTAMPDESRPLVEFMGGWRQVAGERLPMWLRSSSKAVLAERLAGVPAVTDMESVPVAALAHARDVPFLGLRAVSEGSTYEIDWELDSIIDRAGRIRFEKVVLAVIARPGLAVSFRRLRKNFAVTGRELARALAALLSLPEEDPRSLAGESQLRPVSEAG